MNGFKKIGNSTGTLYTYHNNDSLKYFYTYMNKRGLLE